MIILNRIFTGNYLDEGENIGHEIVNLYRPDGKDYYCVYLMSGGDYPHKRLSDFGDNAEKIKEIYFVRGLNENRLEITAKATNVTPVFVPPQEWKSEYSAIEIDRLAEVLTEEHLDNWWGEVVSDLQKKNRLKNLGCKNIEEIKAKARLALNIDAARAALDNNESLDETTAFIEKLSVVIGKDNYCLKCKYNKKGKENIVTLNLGKALLHRAAHLKQLKYIRDKKIFYGGTRLDKLYSKNTEAKHGVSIYVTFEAEKIMHPKEPIYLISGDEPDIPKGKCLKINSRKRLSGSSSATYFDGDEEEVFSKLPDVGWEEVREFAEEKKQFADSFNLLTMAGKDHDELAYSNMLAYFFSQDKPFLSMLLDKFFGIKSRGAEHSIGVDLGVDETDTVIEREHKNIDLLVVCDDYAVVIENKIKSGINGKKYDLYGEEVSNQLDKYYSYVKDNYADRPNRYYAILSPNYNIIDKEALKKGSDGQKAFAKHVITYKELYLLAKDYYNDNSYSMPHRHKFYFEEFLRALSMHTRDKDNDYEERSMQRMERMIATINSKA